MPLTRRDLLARSAAGAAVLAVGDIASLFAASPASATGWGPPVPDPSGILDLPAGFSYRIVSRAGDPLPGGGVTPGRHDGTATFAAPRKGHRIVQNHEIGNADAFPTVADPTLTYDPKAKGGTTTLSLDKHLNRTDEYVSLAGTWSNCAGGLTPWGTWLTCEETETKAGLTADKDHGFVFEVDPTTPSNNVTPTPLIGLGRFAHEAVCIDPLESHVYLTEDGSTPNGLLYRFTPNDTSHTYGALRNGGTLQAMSCSRNGTHVTDLSVFSTPGTTLDVEWVAIPDPVAAATSIRKQFTDAEVTRSRKFEGAWWGNAKIRDDGKGHRWNFTRRDGQAHIVCSFARLSDGSLAEHDGQVWAFDPGSQRLTLEVYFPLNPDPDSDNPDGPDNIAVAPMGLFLAEDGVGVQHLLAVDKHGQTSVFARNRLSSSEFTGVNFAPGAPVMFANIQDEGLCFAITGPFGGS